MVDTSSHEFQFLINQFAKGNVVLFAGAGFSLGAKNEFGTDPPLGSTLSEMLATECGWPYRGEPLPIVYEQAERHLGTAQLRERLWSWYHVRDVAAWHYLLPQIIWYRIYTTNIDDVIESAYRRDSEQTLLPVVLPSPYIESDQFLNVLQCVHLHGSITDVSKRLTFTINDLAEQTAIPNPWYQALADDMQARCLLVVGAQLEEAPFHHYLALRSERAKGVTEVRGKAYLVTNSTSPIRRRQLEDRNFVVFEYTADELFAALLPQLQQHNLDRLNVLKNRYPHQIQAIEQGLVESHSEFLKYFELVNMLSAPQGAVRTFFFLGAEPTWEDISLGVDAERRTFTPLLDALSAASTGIRVVILAGSAGSGKSTLLRRASVELVGRGQTVYFNKSIARIDVNTVLAFLRSLGKRHVYLVVDDAGRQIKSILRITAEAPSELRLTWLLADRPHTLSPFLEDLAHLKPPFVDMAPLTTAECHGIVDKLGKFGYLGKLAGRSRQEQIQEFMIRSQKQLLVAMKEATAGRGFDVIISDEFNTLANDNAKLAYVVACLAFVHGVPVRRRHLLACLDGTDLEKALVLSASLREVLVNWREVEDLLSPRHRVIAQQVVREAAPAWLRREALTRFLSQIAGDLTAATIARRSPEYVAYRGLINSDNMLQLFGEDADIIRTVYEEMKPFYGQDFLFYLQYGKAELFFDNFEIAENYLQQSIGMKGADNFQAEHHLGVLYLKRAYWQQDRGLALGDANKGEEILRGQLHEKGHNQAYACAALVRYKLRYLSRWGAGNLSAELEELYEFAKKGLALNPFDDAIKEAYDKAYRAYLMQAVN